LPYREGWKGRAANERRSYELHSADLEFFERIAQLRHPLFEIVGKQRRADQVQGFLFIMDAARFFERLAPFLFAVIAAAEPSQRQQLDPLRIAQPIDRAGQFLASRIVGARLSTSRSASSDGLEPESSLTGGTSASNSRALVTM
jgi:hypothetical protein